MASSGILSENKARATCSPAVAWGPIACAMVNSQNSPGSVNAMRKALPRMPCGESLLVTLDLLGLELPPSLPILDVPVLVLGAENDRFVFPGALQATAYAYRTQA